ncbi:hypothetical protein L7E55_16395 [Pelotomaculum isophthalicicum JI]|uniref:Uncharacterized protein n=1 Tax=Pelotomaculum isophthalicicum JI TaxID=947010 RepID=A0A9X4H3V3_9FIRM|nr:hypothetical protein [Pelotomaculum isophthalicicum]MDF9409906.1 hypothetical protein [Pelotomaculum isophthalicicum JI]
MAFEHVLIGVYGFQLGQSQALFHIFIKLSIHHRLRRLDMIGIASRYSEDGGRLSNQYTLK